MKKLLKKSLPLLLIASVLALSGVPVSCSSSSNGANMYQRQKSNRGTKVKSNIKVKGTNRANSNTTRTRSF